MTLWLIWVIVNHPSILWVPIVAMLVIGLFFGGRIVRFLGLPPWQAQRHRYVAQIMARLHR
jgi:hypothetical protein